MKYLDTGLRPQLRPRGSPTPRCCSDSWPESDPIFPRLFSPLVHANDPPESLTQGIRSSAPRGNPSTGFEVLAEARASAVPRRCWQLGDLCARRRSHHPNRPRGRGMLRGRLDSGLDRVDVLIWNWLLLGWQLRETNAVGATLDEHREQLPLHTRTSLYSLMQHRKPEHGTVASFCSTVSPARARRMRFVPS